MSIRANLETPETRVPTVALLISCAVAVGLVVTILLSIPAISMGEAGGLVGWLLALMAVAIIAIGISSAILTRRTSR